MEFIEVSINSFCHLSIGVLDAIMPPCCKLSTGVMSGFSQQIRPSQRKCERCNTAKSPSIRLICYKCLLFSEPCKDTPERDRFLQSLRTACWPEVSSSLLCLDVRNSATTRRRGINHVVDGFKHLWRKFVPNFCQL